MVSAGIGARLDGSRSHEFALGEAAVDGDAGERLSPPVALVLCRPNGRAAPEPPRRPPPPSGRSPRPRPTAGPTGGERPQRRLLRRLLQAGARRTAAAPTGCTANTDSATARRCAGTKVMEHSGELCEPARVLSPELPPLVMCERRRMTGNAATCNAQCVSDGVQSACMSGDACCPTGCARKRRRRLQRRSAGNMIVEVGERCESVPRCVRPSRRLMSPTRSPWRHGHRRPARPAARTTCDANPRSACGPADGFLPRPSAGAAPTSTARRIWAPPVPRRRTAAPGFCADGKCCDQPVRRVALPLVRHQGCAGAVVKTPTTSPPARQAAPATPLGVCQKRMGQPCQGGGEVAARGSAPTASACKRLVPGPLPESAARGPARRCATPPSAECASPKTCDGRRRLRARYPPMAPQRRCGLSNGEATGIGGLQDGARRPRFPRGLPARRAPTSYDLEGRPNSCTVKRLSPAAPSPRRRSAPNVKGAHQLPAGPRRWRSPPGAPVGRRYYWRLRALQQRRLLAVVGDPLRGRRAAEQGLQRRRVRRHPVAPATPTSG
jgi:hypothetical protein